MDVRVGAEGITEESGEVRGCGSSRRSDSVTAKSEQWLLLAC